MTTEVYTSGGESWIDDTEWNDYSIHVGDVTIDHLHSETMLSLAKAIVDHLIVNGHNFELVKSPEQDQMYQLEIQDEYGKKREQFN